MLNEWGDDPYPTDEWYWDKVEKYVYDDKRDEALPMRPIHPRYYPGLPQHRYRLGVGI